VTSSKARYRFSIIIPTFQRRDLVLELVDALRGQDYDRPFEVIVVVDGSTDGSADALASVSCDFPLEVVQQENQGLSQSRNNGARIASGEILLFLDDDMIPHPRLLAEHDRSHSEGADIVRGSIPLHPDSPANLLSEGVGEWAREQHARLEASQERLHFTEVLNGQFSFRNELFERLGGFDTRYTRRGSYGNEDLDFGHRALEAGCAAVYNGRAITWQRYTVATEEYLRRYMQVGKADVQLVRKYPELQARVFGKESMSSLLNRTIKWPALMMPGVAGWLARLLTPPIARRVDAGQRGWMLTRMLFAVRELQYWRGVDAGGGIPKPRPVRVLCYHAIADLNRYDSLSKYGVPPDDFAWQLESMQRRGFTFISADEFLRYLETGTGLPRKPTLVTFDDCYEDLFEAAFPILDKLNIPALAFAVGSKMGGTMDWVEGPAKTELRLLGAPELCLLNRSGVVIGNHSASHRYFPALSSEEICQELENGARLLNGAGLDSSHFVAYPFGGYNSAVVDVARKTGVRAAFTVDSGLAKRGVDPLRIPRIEIFRSDVGLRFWSIIASRGWRPGGAVEKLRMRLQLRTRIRRILGRRNEVQASGAS
jgi:glycosyltransferase involved in cell wall biosynthesis